MFLHKYASVSNAQWHGMEGLPFRRPFVLLAVERKHWVYVQPFLLLLFYHMYMYACSSVYKMESGSEEESRSFSI